VAAQAFLLNYPVQLFTRTRITGSGSNYCFAREFNALVSVGLILVPLVTDQMVQLLKGIPTWLETIQDNLSF